jgi:hypothetical protein
LEVQSVDFGSTTEKNPVIREEVQIVDAEKCNHSTQAAHPLNIGSTRKPTKSKCTKNKNNPVTRDKVHILENEKHNHLARGVHPLNIEKYKKPDKVQM